MSWALIRVPDEMLTVNNGRTFLVVRSPREPFDKLEVGPVDVVASGLQDETYISIDVRFAE